MARWVPFYLACAAIVIGTMLLWNAPAYPQPSERCGPLPLFEYAMKQIGEELMAVGITGTGTGGQAIRFYVNPVGRGWTVLAMDGTGLACKVVEGTSFDFAKPPPPPLSPPL